MHDGRTVPVTSVSNAAACTAALSLLSSSATVRETLRIHLTDMQWESSRAPFSGTVPVHGCGQQLSLIHI